MKPLSALAPNRCANDWNEGSARTARSKHRQNALRKASFSTASVTCGRRPGKGFFDASAALVGCGHVSGLLMRQVWPLALMLCADRVPILFMHLEVR